MSKPTPTIGRIVHYKLSAQDAEAINRRREDAVRTLNPAPGIGRSADGDQVHVGNRVSEGDVFPMMITRVWGLDLDAQAPTAERLVNGQVFLDGNDVYWATSVHEGDGVRHYRWPLAVGGTFSSPSTDSKAHVHIDSTHVIPSSVFSRRDQQILQSIVANGGTVTIA